MKNKLKQLLKNMPTYRKLGENPSIADQSYNFGIMLCKDAVKKWIKKYGT